MLIVFIGPPGAGKGTQSRRLTEYLGVPHLSTGEMFRQAIAADTPLGRQAAQYISHGHLVPDNLTVQMVGERLAKPDCDAGCLFDGFPRTLGQARSLDTYLQLHGTPLDVALELVVDYDELTRRMLARAKLEHRADDTPQTIANRFAVYREQTTPLLDYYQAQGKLAKVNGMGSADEVFDRIHDCLEPLRKS